MRLLESGKEVEGSASWHLSIWEWVCDASCTKSVEQAAGVGHPLATQESSVSERERESECVCVCVCWRGTDRVMCEVTLKERRTCILCNNARSPALLSIIEIGWNL